MLLQRSEWWHELGATDHELLVALDTWHAALFGWIDRRLADHGAEAWPALREAIAPEPADRVLEVGTGCGVGSPGLPGCLGRITSIRWSLPMRPLRTSSQARRKCGSERCCVPV